MFLIFLLSALFDFHQISSMHTPKASSLSNLAQNNNSCQLTPRLQTCKIINGSRAQSFEVDNTKETENKTERRLFASSSDDDQITDNDQEEILQLIEEDSRQKRANEKTNNSSLGDGTPQQPPLSSPILANSQILERSFHEEKNKNHVFNYKFSEEELKKILPDNIDEITPDILNELLQLFDKKNWFKIGSLSIEDVILVDLLKESKDALILHLNNCYKFLSLKDEEDNYLGWLIYRISSENDESFIEIDTCFIAKNLNWVKVHDMHKKLEIICQELNYKKIISNPLTDKEKEFYKKIGYTKSKNNLSLVKNIKS